MNTNLFDSIIDDLLAREDQLALEQESVSGKDPERESVLLQERLLNMMDCLKIQKEALQATESSEN